MTRFLKLLVCPMYSLLHLGHLIKYMTFLMEQSIFFTDDEGVVGRIFEGDGWICKDQGAGAAPWVHAF